MGSWSSPPSSRMACVALVMALVSAHLPALAQQPKIWRIAFLQSGGPADSGGYLEALRKGLRELGYVEGQNMVIDPWWAEGRRERLSQLATDALQRSPDVIVGSSTGIIAAAKRATSRIPIVMAAGSDPVEAGLVASLARPGGNITGLTTMAGETTGKLVEIIREVVPTASRALVLLSADRSSQAKWNDAQDAGEALKLVMELIKVTNTQEIESAFAAIARERKRVVLVVPADSLLLSKRKLIVQLAAAAKLPAIYSRDEFVRDGGLVSYGLSLTYMWDRSASYVDRIFKGARPGDLPIEQPTKFHLVFNRKAATALGLVVPQELMMRADEVID